MNPAPPDAPTSSRGSRDLFATVTKTLGLLSPRERRSLYLLLPQVVLMAFFEVVGIASITPFLALVSNPASVESDPRLAWLNARLNFTEPNQLLIFLGVGALVVLTVSNAFTAWTTYQLNRFSYLRGYTLSKRLLIRYLSQPYAFFLGHNTAHLGTNLLTEVQQVVVGVIVPGVKMIAKVVVALFVIGLLFAVDPILALSVTGTLGAVYGGLIVASRRKLRRIGKVRVAANQRRFKVAGEALSGIKDLKLLGREGLFVEQFARSAKRYASTQATSKMVSELPRYALETVAFGGIVLIVIYLLARGQGIGQALPVIGLYAFAAYRLMPALQQVFIGVTTVHFNVAGLELLYKDLEGPDPTLRSGRDALPALPFRERLELRGVTFAYPDTERAAVQNLSLTVRANTSVAFVGHTGSGKTTLVDIILGLLEPQGGALLVDGVTLTPENLPNWQKSIGYVPQHIYLADDTVASNIAFGIPNEKIDPGALERAAKVAHLHTFITEELPDGYSTVVGERGIRLSGGQRQRIGIARALYHDPATLVLDEATSALDGITEENVFAAVDNLAGEKTLIMIAHRLSTVRNCDQIFLLDRGVIAAQGTYNELFEHSATFRAMARAAGRPDSTRQPALGVRHGG